MEEANRKIFEQHMRALEQPKKSETPPKPKVVSIQAVDIEEQFNSNQLNSKSIDQSVVVKEHVVNKTVSEDLPPDSERSNNFPSSRSDQPEGGKEKKHRKHKHHHSQEAESQPNQQANVGHPQVQPTMQMQQWFAQNANQSSGADVYQLQATHQQYNQQPVSYRPPASSTNNTFRSSGSQEAESPMNRIFLKPKPDDPAGRPGMLDTVPEQSYPQQPPRHPPPPLPSKNHVVNSANLFASAVNMYSGANKASHAMMAAVSNPSK